MILVMITITRMVAGAADDDTAAGAADGAGAAPKLCPLGVRSPESAPSTQVARDSCNLKPGGKPSRQKVLISDFLEDMRHSHLGKPFSQDLRDPAIQTSSFHGKSAPPAIQTNLFLEKIHPI